MCHYLLGRYTCLACDRESNLLAVGCDTGQIAMYPFSIASYMCVKSTRAYRQFSYSCLDCTIIVSKKTLKM